MACIVFVLNGDKNQNPQNSLELQTKAKLSLDQNLRSSVKKSHAEFPIRQNCQRNDAAGIQGNYHETSDYFENPKKSLLKSSYPKNTCQNFPTQKNPEIKIFKPKKILQPSLSLEIWSTPWSCVQLQECYPLVARWLGYPCVMGRILKPLGMAKR